MSRPTWNQMALIDDKLQGWWYGSGILCVSYWILFGNDHKVGSPPPHTPLEYRHNDVRGHHVQQTTLSRVSSSFHRHGRKKYRFVRWLRGETIGQSIVTTMFRKVHNYYDIVSENN